MKKQVRTRRQYMLDKAQAHQAMISHAKGCSEDKVPFILKAELERQAKERERLSESRVD